MGVLTKTWHHPDSEKLFCEEIDVGEVSLSLSRFLSLSLARSLSLSLSCAQVGPKRDTQETELGLDKNKKKVLLD